eukprot:2279419-Rhodomonas_salina.1
MCHIYGTDTPCNMHTTGPTGVPGQPGGQQARALRRMTEEGGGVHTHDTRVHSGLEYTRTRSRTLLPLGAQLSSPPHLSSLSSSPRPSSSARSPSSSSFSSGGIEAGLVCRECVLSGASCSSGLRVVRCDTEAPLDVIRREEDDDDDDDDDENENDDDDDDDEGDKEGGGGG